MGMRDVHFIRRRNRGISRRRFVGRLLATGAAIAFGQTWLDLATQGGRDGGGQYTGYAEASDTVVSTATCADGRCLSSDEFRTLEALTAVIIPSDEQGPGAREAGVAQQIQQSTLHAEPVRRRYAEGLQAINGLAQKRHGQAFIELSHDKQRELFTFLELAYARLWPQVPPATFSGKVQWKLQHLYYRQLAGVSDPALILVDQVVRDTAEAFYSTPIAWEWLGYSGPPFPFGYAGRGHSCIPEA